MSRTKFLLLAAVLLLVVLLISACAAPQSPAMKEEKEKVSEEKKAEKAQAPVVLTAVSSFNRDALEHEGFWIFVDKLEQIGQGRVQIDYRGGPEVIPPLEQADALKTGIIDIFTGPEAYYPHLVPEVMIFKLTPFTPWEERENGCYDLFNQIHQEKLNAYYLGKTLTGIPYHLFSNKPINKADLKGITLRVSATYKAMVDELGGAPLSIPGGEVYTALERGVVDGFGWAGIGIIGAGWHEVTKYEIDPGFYNASTVTLVNLDTWNNLPKDVQEILNKAMVEAERDIHARYVKMYQDERKARRDGGMELITLTGVEAEKYLKAAYDKGWKEVIDKNPDYGPRFKELMYK
ncbi:MAG: TRAP transporter substrate-binding protein DctP [Bacillota bacterium]